MENYRPFSDKSPRRVSGFVNRINDIRHYPGKNLLSFLMVEGPMDEQFFGRFIDEEKCHIEAIGGRETVIQVLSLLEQRAISGVLAIVDADYDILMSIYPATPNLLFTDTHDVETMIIKSSALERVLQRFCTKEKIEKLKTRSGREDIRAVIIECGKPIGYLRLISKRDGLNLKFDDIDFRSFIDMQLFTPNVGALIESVAINGHNGIDKLQSLDITKEEIKSKIEQLEKSNLDHWYVCRGHDLTQILSIAFHKHIAKSKVKNLTQEAIEGTLAFAFDLSFFQKTDLYSSIKKWENDNEPFVVLKTQA